ncbi:60s ribosomal protein [Cyclospora cayetanensis]|uniref:60s ribosomal protein n=1 Tax=Cyclospora cayetanensis TaxID=88456 RepID=A0A1D3CSL0_9EIME|nr:60s ribosomal protein [Cyclospora cayetanensis]
MIILVAVFLKEAGGAGSHALVRAPLRGATSVRAERRLGTSILFDVKNGRRRLRNIPKCDACSLERTSSNNRGSRLLLEASWGHAFHGFQRRDSSAAIVCLNACALSCSKLSQEALNAAVVSILQGAQEKKRNFVETIELQISLKDYDTQRDKRFSGSVRLPHVPRPKVKICVFGDAVHIEEAKALGLDCMDIEDMKKINRNKKIVKKLTRKYDAFLASQSLVPQITRFLGPGLSKAGKFPAQITHQDKIEEKILEVRSSIKFQLKKVLCLGVAVANVEMTEAQVRYNLTIAINFLVSLLKKNWNNVKRLHIKSTMGKCHTIYG